MKECHIKRLDYLTRQPRAAVTVAVIILSYTMAKSNLYTKAFILASSSKGIRVQQGVCGGVGKGWQQVAGMVGEGGS